MNLEGLFTETKVRWDESLSSDSLMLNGEVMHGEPLARVSAHLDVIRQRIKSSLFAHIKSDNNFPTGAGIASSASAFAALTLAAIHADGENLSTQELSTIARIGSGSASRSIPSGFVEWHTGNSHEESFAESVAEPSHWDLVDVIAIVSEEHKKVTSKAGHPSAITSDYQKARIAGAGKRLEVCKTALLNRDFPTFASVVEKDSDMMHAVMMTSTPSLFYWEPTSLEIMSTVRQMRADGVSVCYTLDAGPNVHCICLSEDVEQVRVQIGAIHGVYETRTAHCGGGAVIVDTKPN